MFNLHSLSFLNDGEVHTLFDPTEAEIISGCKIYDLDSDEVLKHIKGLDEAVHTVIFDVPVYKDFLSSQKLQGL